jgi:hypothetical protein
LTTQNHRQYLSGTIEGGIYKYNLAETETAYTVIVGIFKTRVKINRGGGVLPVTRKGVKRCMSVSYLHCKKRLSFFPSPAGMSQIHLSQAGKNLIIPGQGEFG